MRRSLYEFYTLLVCLGSLIGLVVALLWFMHGVLSWSDPELMVSSWTYAVHERMNDTGRSVQAAFRMAGSTTRSRT